ncbi:hypothetical protein HOY80DRAFT_1074188 [Tuber brumale]|nr:hypothetical protein HOY80DRAFT_1074188 [Tuber brumale]
MLGMLALSYLFTITTYSPVALFAVGGSSLSVRLGALCRLFVFLIPLAVRNPWVCNLPLTGKPFAVAYPHSRLPLVGDLPPVFARRIAGSGSIWEQYGDGARILRRFQIYDICRDTCYDNGCLDKESYVLETVVKYES